MKGVIVSLLSNLKKINLLESLYLLCLVFLPTQLGKHFWPQYSYVLGIRIDYLSPTLYFFDLLLFFAAALFLFKFRSKIVKKLSSHQFGIWRYGILLIFASFVTSFFTAERPELVLYGAIKFFEMSIFALITYVLLQSQKIKDKALIALTVTLVFESLLGALQFVLQRTVGGPLYFLGERTFSASTPGIATALVQGELLLRPYGTLPHPNVLSGYILATMIIVFILAKERKSFPAYSLIALGLGSLAIVLSLSRINILLLFAFLLIVFLKRLRSKKSRSVLGLVFFTFAIFTVPFLGDRFGELRLGSETLTLRQDFAVAALQMVSGSPLVGVGYSHYLVNAPEYLSIKSVVLFVQPVHNIYLLILSENGLIGAMGFVLLVYGLLRHLFKLKSPERIYIAFLMMACLVIGAVDHYLITLQQGQFLLAFVIGFVLSYPTQSFGQRTGKKFPNFRTRVVKSKSKR